MRKEIEKMTRSRPSDKGKPDHASLEEGTLEGWSAIML